MDNYPVSKNALTFDIMNDISKFRGRELSLSVWPGPCCDRGRGGAEDRG